MSSDFQTTSEREDRRSALDEFAAAAPTSKGELVPIQMGGPIEIHGAQQVAVYRDESRVLTKIRALAAAAGDDWIYRYPVKNRKKGTTEYIEGKTVKLANAVARIYGNCEVDCRAQDLGTVWLYHARFIDLETGFSMTRPFQQRKSAGKLGGGDAERNLDAAFSIGASKAIRNVVCNALETITDYAFEEAKGALVDKIGKNIDGWRQRAIERVSAHVELARVEAVVGRPAKDWLAGDIAMVIASMRAVTEGMANLDETFPPLTATGEVEETDERQMANARLDEFADRGGTQRMSTDPGGDAADPIPPPPGSAAANPRDLAISLIAEIARDPRRSVQEREDELAAREIPLLDSGLPTPFVKQLLATGGKIARGEYKDPAAALRYLRQLP